MDLTLEGGKVVAEADNHQGQVILAGSDGVGQHDTIFEDSLCDLAQGKTLGSKFENSLDHVLLRVRPVQSI